MLIVGAIMPSPKKRKKKPLGKKPAKKAAGEKPTKKAASKKPPAKKSASGKKVPKTKSKPLIDPDSEGGKVLARLRAQIDHPENQNCVWVVELVIPPGIFMARRIPEPVDLEALDAEIKASAEALNYGNDPERHRFVITRTDLGGVARQYAKAMCEDIPNPTVPMRPYDLFTIDAIFHAQFIGDEEY